MQDLTPVKVSISQMKQFLTLLQTGKPVTPKGDKWTGFEWLTLAGTCLFLRKRDGFEARVMSIGGAASSNEQLEAHEESIRKDILKVIEWYADVADRADSGPRYPDDIVKVFVVSGDGKHELIEPEADGSQDQFFEDSF